MEQDTAVLPEAFRLSEQICIWGWCRWEERRPVQSVKYNHLYHSTFVLPTLCSEYAHLIGNLPYKYNDNIEAIAFLPVLQ